MSTAVAAAHLSSDIEAKLPGDGEHGYTEDDAVHVAQCQGNSQGDRGSEEERACGACAWCDAPLTLMHACTPPAGRGEVHHCSDRCVHLEQVEPRLLILCNRKTNVLRAFPVVSWTAVMRIFPLPALPSSCGGCVQLQYPPMTSIESAPACSRVV